MTSDLTAQSNTYCVIMAGGVGSRFWPMSTPEFPKQFHDILGIGKTLIRMTFERVLPICNAQNILVVTNSRYKDQVKEQLPELAENQILGEPMLRNTAPCLAYANFWIAKKNPNANIIVLSADQLISNETQFLNDLNIALKAAAAGSHIVTLGIKPSEPNTGYGYIQFDDESFYDENRLRKVKTFTEKPDLEHAEKFVSSGEFFWNAGIFIWSLSTIQAAFKEHLEDVYTLFNEDPEVYGTEGEKEFIDRIYPVCQNISIDYGILEKSEDVLVVLSDFGWSDLGTWGSVYQQLPHDEHENAVGKSKVKFIESSGNVVRVSSNMQAVIQGLDGYIVVESNGNLLICKQDQQQRIKEFSKAFIKK